MSPSSTSSPEIKSFYDLKADLKNSTLDFADLRGKTVLIVNTASNCGFTGQYSGLEELHKKYKDQGLVVIGFPCNQFGGQEPGSDDSIEQFCQVNHGVTFPLAKKSDVNGDNTNEVFRYLKAAAPGILGLTRVKWNFEKWLTSPTGTEIKRYASTTGPSSLEKDIEAFLAQQK